MTYKQRFGRYEVKVDGVAWKWFKSLDNAVDEYNFWTECDDEFEDCVELVDLKTGEVLMKYTVEEPDAQAIEEARAAAEAQALAAAEVEAARAGGKTGVYELYYTGCGYPSKVQIDAEAKANGFTHSYYASEYGYNAMYNGSTVVVYNNPDSLPPLMRKDALVNGKPIA